MKFLFVFLSTLDFCITAVLLNMTGEHMELNPVAASIYSRYGAVGIGILKLSVVSFVLGVYAMAKTTKPKLTMFMLGFACVANGIASLFGIITYGAITFARS